MAGSGYLALCGLAMTFVSVATMFVVMFRMIRIINRDPGPEGWIPIWSIFTRTAYLYHPIRRYRAQNGKDSMYRTMQVCWFLFGIGFLSVMGSALVDHLLQH
jgi:hypothetical protein